MPKNHDLSVCKNWEASFCWTLQENSSAGWFWSGLKRYWTILEEQAGFRTWSELYGQYSDAENYCGTQDWVPGSPLTWRPLTVSAERFWGSSSNSMKYLSRQSQSLEGSTRFPGHSGLAVKDSLCKKVWYSVLLEDPGFADDLALISNRIQNIKDMTCALGEQRQGWPEHYCHKYKKGAKKCDVSCDDCRVTDWARRLTSSGTLGVLWVRGIRQQMPFYTCCKLSMKQWIVVRLLLGYSSLISRRDLILLTTLSDARTGQIWLILCFWNGSRLSWQTGRKQLESEEHWKEEYPKGQN